MSNILSEIKCYPRTIDEYQALIKAEERKGGRKVSDDDDVVKFVIDHRNFKEHIIIFPPKE